MTGYNNSAGFPPLDVHCVCFKAPIGDRDKVLVELLGSTKNNTGVFYGESRGGEIRACFKMREVLILDNQIFYNGKPIEYLVVREPNDKLWRCPYP